MFIERPIAKRIRVNGENVKRIKRKYLLLENGLVIVDLKATETKHRGHIKNGSMNIDSHCVCLSVQ